MGPEKLLITSSRLHCGKNVMAAPAEEFVEAATTRPAFPGDADDGAPLIETGNGWLMMLCKRSNAILYSRASG